MNMSHHLAFRPIKLDYYLTRFQPIFIQGLGNFNRDRNQNNLLYSTGLISVSKGFAVTSTISGQDE